MPVEVVFEIGKPFPNITSVIEHLGGLPGWVGVSLALHDDFIGDTKQLRRLTPSEVAPTKGTGG